MPENNTIVSVSGFLSHIIFKDHDPFQYNAMHEVHHFIIDIDTIVFFGHVPLTPASPTKLGMHLSICSYYMCSFQHYTVQVYLSKKIRNRLHRQLTLMHSTV